MKMKERDNKLLRRIDEIAGVPIVFWCGLVHRKRLVPKTITRIGLFFFAAMGDTLLASSVVADLKRRYPQATIIAFASHANKAITGLINGIDEIVDVSITNPFSALRAVRAHDVDVLIDFGQWARISAILACFAKTKLTIGFQTDGQYRHFAYDLPVRHRNDRHELENFRELVRCIDVQPSGMPQIKNMEVPYAYIPESPYVIFHPWAAGFRHELREWPLNCWKQLEEYLTKKGYRIVLTGGPADREKSLKLGDLFNTAPIVFAGKSNLGQTASLLKGAACVVSVNTGIMHLAATQNVPLIALHGPTNPKRWGPLGKKSIVLGPGPEKGGAYLNLGFEYPPSPADCMGMIAVEDVIVAVEKSLAQKEA